MTSHEREEGEMLALDFDKRGGLLPVIVQDAETLEVLMQGWSNKEAWNKTLETGKAVFWSTSRNELWVKGETSGDFLAVQEIRVDCDQDCLLYLVFRSGSGVCHTKDPEKGGHRSTCFYRAYDPGRALLIKK